MKKFLLLFVTLIPAVGWATHSDAADDSDTAGDRASCNASFQQDCPADTTYSSEAVAAPIGNIGADAIETIVLIILLGSTLILRIAKRSWGTRLETGARHQ